jgi:hypothetical protein
VIALWDEATDVIRGVLKGDLNAFRRLVGVGALGYNYVSIFWVSGFFQRSNFLCFDAVSSFVTITKRD